MFRKIQYAFEDYVLWPVGNFLARINIYRRMRDAEFVTEVQNLQINMLHSTLAYGAGEHMVACNALYDIANVTESVNSPNGTTRKIGRMVADVLNRLETGPEELNDEPGDLFEAANDTAEAQVAA